MLLLLMVASLMAGMKVVVDAALMLRSLGMAGGGITWMEFGECVSDVAEVGEEVVVACACVMIDAPPFIVTGSWHVSVAVEGIGMAAMSASSSTRSSRRRSSPRGCT